MAPGHLQSVQNVMQCTELGILAQAATVRLGLSNIMSCANQVDNAWDRQNHGQTTTWPHLSGAEASNILRQNYQNSIMACLMRVSLVEWPWCLQSCSRPSMAIPMATGDGEGKMMTWPSALCVRWLPLLPPPPAKDIHEVLADPALPIAALLLGVISRNELYHQAASWFSKRHFVAYIDGLCQRSDSDAAWCIVCCALVKRLRKLAYFVPLLAHHEIYKARANVLKNGSPVSKRD